VEGEEGAGTAAGSPLSPTAMQIRNKSVRRRLLIAVIPLLLLSSGALRAQDGSFGGRLYHEKADCQFCHGVNGDGRGDPRSPGKASDLRATKLDREQLVEVIKCGRPGSEMPHFDKYAYEDKSCYGLSAVDLGPQLPPQPHSTSLTKREIEVLADYILATYKGK
jgi:mono/diheme cytochrome c family protein